MELYENTTNWSTLVLSQLVSINYLDLLLYWSTAIRFYLGYRADIKLNGEKYHGVFLNNPELVDDYKDSKCPSFCCITFLWCNSVISNISVLDSIKDILQVEEGESYACEGQNYPTTTEDPDIPDCLLSARYNRLLPIFVIPDQKRVISGSLKWLCKMSRMDISFMFYDLIFLFQRFLDSSPFDIAQKVTYGAAEAHLMRDVYLYLANVSCR